VILPCLHHVVCVCVITHLFSYVSRVLTAVGLVNGKRSFSTSTELLSLNRLPENLLHVITSTTFAAALNLVEICPWRASGQICEI